MCCWHIVGASRPTEMYPHDASHLELKTAQGTILNMD